MSMKVVLSCFLGFCLIVAMELSKGHLCSEGAQGRNARFEVVRQEPGVEGTQLTQLLATLQV